MAKYTLNKVNEFDPYAHVEISRNRRGEEIMKKDGTPLKYLGTAAKILWFRKVYPHGAIIVEEVETPQQDFGTTVKYKAEVWLDIKDPKPVASWQHQETVWDVADMDNVVSKVQTIVAGKALSKAGFGCEIEFELGAVSEGETAIETNPEESVAEASEVPETPKKKRGRPKKVQEPEPSDFLQEAENLLKNTVKEEIQKKIDEPQDVSEEDKLKEALAVKIELKKGASPNLIRFEGKTIEEVVKLRPGFCSVVKNNDNVKKCLTEECVNAAIYIADHA